MFDFFNNFSNIEEQLVTYLESFLQVTGIILVILGSLFCFAGYRLFKILLIIMGVIIGGMIGLLITFGNPLGFIVGALIGALIFFVLYFIGIFLMGALLGILIVAIFSFFVTTPPALFLIMALIGGVLALVYEKLIMIVSTSYTGAVHFVIGGYFLWFGTIRIFTLSAFGLFPLLIVAFTLIGILVQYEVFSGKVRKTENRKISNPTKYKENTSQNLSDNYDSIQVLEPVPSIVPNKDFIMYRHQTSQGENDSQNSIHGKSKIMNFRIIQLNGINPNKIYLVKGEVQENQLVAEFGRSIAFEPTNVAVEDPVISRKHLKFISDNYKLYVTQYKVTNNTFINGHELKPNETRSIQMGDIMNIGGVEFEIVS